MPNKKNEKVIRIAIKNGDSTKVKVDFHGGVFSLAEFTSLVMAVIETYTVGLLEKNKKEEVFKYWNNIFGIFLNKIVPQDTHYKLSKEHKKFKKTVDSTLGRDETEEDKKKTEDNRLEAYLLCRDILTTEVGMTEQTADLLLNKRLNLLDPDLKVFKDEKKQ